MMIVAFIVGLCFGSFVFALYERFVCQIRLFAPRSFCFACEKTLKFYHLVPLFSFISLRGKCAFCGAKISPLSPLCELMCGILFVFAWQFSANTFEFAFLSLYLATLLLLSLIDIKCKAVPEILLWINFIFALCVAYDENEFLFGSFLIDALIFAGGIFLLKSFVSCILNIRRQHEKLESMGEADILLIAGMGAILGLKFGFYALFATSLLVLPCFFFVKKNTPIPLIPFLSLAFVGVFSVKDGL